MWPQGHMKTSLVILKFEDMEITEEQKQLLITTTLENGQNAWDFIQSSPEVSRPWVAAGILSCMKKGYRLNLMMVGWEARDLRSAYITKDR